MTHPFFDMPNYPWWHKPEADDLWRSLFQAIPIPADIDRIYKGLEPLHPLALGQPPDLIWQEALNNLTRYGALRKLCDDLLADEAWQKAVAFRAAVQAVIDARPAETIRVIAESVPVPVLDRDTLRGHLKALEDDAHPLKVLLVRGQKSSGKSHCRYLFDYAARCRGEDSVYLYQGLIGNVADAVAELFLALDPEYRPPDFYTSDSASYLGICREMLRVARLRDQTLWIAVDDLGVSSPDGAPLLDKEIRLFFDQLARMLANPPYRERFRMMLIDYPAVDEPPKWISDIWEENVSAEADILAGHVAEALTEWAARRRKTLLEDEVKRYTQQVMDARVTPAPPGRDGRPDQRSPLKRMYDTLVEILKSI